MPIQHRNIAKIFHYKIAKILRNIVAIFQQHDSKVKKIHFKNVDT